MDPMYITLELVYASSRSGDDSRIIWHKDIEMMFPPTPGLRILWDLLKGADREFVVHWVTYDARTGYYTAHHYEEVDPDRFPEIIAEGYSVWDRIR